MIELPGAPSFAITQDASGAIRLTGGVPDDATRNQWMNAIRLAPVMSPSTATCACSASTRMLPPAGSPSSPPSWP